MNTDSMVTIRPTLRALDKQQSCCKVSALSVAHYTGCCRRRTHRNECDSASPPHMWQNTHSTMTTPHLKLSLSENSAVRCGACLRHHACGCPPSEAIGCERDGDLCQCRTASCRAGPPPLCPHTGTTPPEVTDRSESGFGSLHHTRCCTVPIGPTHSSHHLSQHLFHSLSHWVNSFQDKLHCDSSYHPHSVVVAGPSINMESA